MLLLASAHIWTSHGKLYSPASLKAFTRADAYLLVVSSRHRVLHVSCSEKCQQGANTTFYLSRVITRCLRMCQFPLFITVKTSTHEISGSVVLVGLWVQTDKQEVKPQTNRHCLTTSLLYSLLSFF